MGVTVSGGQRRSAPVMMTLQKAQQIMETDRFKAIGTSAEVGAADSHELVDSLPMRL